MDRDDAMTALDEVERRRQAVQAGARWPVTVLIVWGIGTLVVEPAFALLAERPWTLVFPSALVAAFIVWVSGYAARQRVTAHGLTWRYLVYAAIWAVLHTAYVLAFTIGELRSVPFVLGATLAVAAPMLAGAVIEGRRS